jgi:hypothetical protein
MTKVYHSRGIRKNYTFDELKRAKWMEIKSAELYENAYGNKEGLFLSMQQHYPRGKCHLTVYYKLLGKEIPNEFMKSLKTKISKELVGKLILGIVNKERPILDGLCGWD